MDKVIVITGASSGIGAATSKLLGSKGDSLAICARREKEIHRVAEESGPNAMAVVADATRRADIERLRDAAIRRFGHIDVWINNAGRGIHRKVMELKDEDFDQIMAINVKSALYGMQAIIPHFQERGQGHLINISSFLGRVPYVPMRSAYYAAKAALNALTANLRVDLKSTHPGIHVSVVMPGVVTTAFAANAMFAPPQTGAWASSIPTQSADQVAAVIAALIDKPVAEVYTNPAAAEIAKRYYEDVQAFEEKAFSQRP